MHCVDYVRSTDSFRIPGYSSGVTRGRLDIDIHLSKGSNDRRNGSLEGFAMVKAGGIKHLAI